MVLGFYSGFVQCLQWVCGDDSGRWLMITQTCRLDASNLNRALALLRQGYSRRTPAQAVNSAAYMVAKFTMSKMPMVDTGRMDSELQVTSVPIMKTFTKGPRKGQRGATDETAIMMNAATVESPQGVYDNDRMRNMAMMIVIARLHPNSKYSIQTGNYWGITNMPNFRRSSFGRAYGDPDMATRLFWDWVEEAAERMVRARHSSKGFLKSCWVPAILALEPFVAPSLRGAVARFRGDVAAARGTGSAGVIPDSGWGRPAPEGALVVTAEIANAAGVGGRNMVLNEKHNAALWDIAPPLLQRSIQEEADNIFRTVGQRALEQERAPLLMLGMRVT